MSTRAWDWVFPTAPSWISAPPLIRSDGSGKPWLCLQVKDVHRFFWTCHCLVRKSQSSSEATDGVNGFGKAFAPYVAHTWMQVVRM